MHIHFSEIYFVSYEMYLQFISALLVFNQREGNTCNTTAHWSVSILHMLHICSAIYQFVLRILAI
jgi:hypothetical protein